MGCRVVLVNEFDEIACQKEVLPPRCTAPANDGSRSSDLKAVPIALSSSPTEAGRVVAAADARGSSITVLQTEQFYSKLVLTQ
jgi:hypothetical protein